MTDGVPHILEALFECTLDMINKDLEEFPEHRINFFKMLQSINMYCFDGWLWFSMSTDLLLFVCSTAVIICPTIQSVS